MRLLRATVSACDASASGIVGFDLVVRNVSCLVCHQQCAGEELTLHNLGESLLYF